MRAVIESVANKTYGKCACAEAMSDIDALTTALQRLQLDSTSNSTLLFDDVNCRDADENGGGLPTRVRQLVADAKHLVGGTLSSSVDRETRVGVLVDTTMHTLTGVFRHCCRCLITTASSSSQSAGVADKLLDAAWSLRTTVAAAGAVLEADAAETPPGPALDRAKTALLATAESLAKSLKLLVHEVKNV